MAQVAYRTGLELDENRLDWDGLNPRPLAWSAWYPLAEGAARSRPLRGAFFDLEDVEEEGALADSAAFPVVLLSHGTGGAPESLGWLAKRLAAWGYVVIGAHHHGNTGREPYRAEGFLCWWERAAALSALLTKLNEAGPFAGRLDMTRVHGVGFSLGAYTVLALAGARSSMDQYQAWVSTTGAHSDAPREFPGVGRKLPVLLENSATFQASWARQGHSFHDPRIRSVTAIAAPPPVRAFEVETLRSIETPVSLITGEADLEAPSSECSDWLIRANPRFERLSVGEAVGHYTFVGHPVGDVSDEQAFLFEDGPGVSRAKVHDMVEARVLATIRDAETR